jgi:hypothetical protein
VVPFLTAGDTLKMLGEAYLARIEAYMQVERLKEALQDAEELQFLLANMDRAVTDPAVKAFVNATTELPFLRKLWQLI